MVTKWASQEAKDRNEQIHNTVKDRFRASLFAYWRWKRQTEAVLKARAASRATRAARRRSKTTLSDADEREAARDEREAALDQLTAGGQPPTEQDYNQSLQDQQEAVNDFLEAARIQQEAEAMAIPAWSEYIPFIFISEETSGVATREIRTWGPAPSAFLIREIQMIPQEAPSKHHKIDLVITNYEHNTDANYPTGDSVFTKTIGGAGIPAAELESKIRWPDVPAKLDNLRIRGEPGNYIVAVNEYVSPATAVIDGQIIVLVEDIPFAVQPVIQPTRPPVVVQPRPLSFPSQDPYARGYRNYVPYTFPRPVFQLDELIPITRETTWDQIPAGAYLFGTPTSTFPNPITRAPAPGQGTFRGGLTIHVAGR